MTKSYRLRQRLLTIAAQVCSLQAGCSPSGFAMPALSGFRESFNFLCLSLAVIFCLGYS